MKCQYHEGQVKTHICLKGLCKHAVLCPICIAKDHQNHMTIELLQFKRSVANLILQHDNPEPLDTLNELTLQIAKFDQILQESLKLLYQKRKETIEFDHFKQVEGILQVEHPTNSQQMALKKVGQHMLFYKDQSNQWTFQLVADNQEYKIWDKLIQDLRDQVKQQTNQLSKILDSLQQISKLIDSEAKQKKIIINSNNSDPQNDGFNNISKKIKAEGRELDTQQQQDEFFKAEQQQSIRLLRMLENNSDSEDSEPKIIHQVQQQIPIPQSQTTPQLQQQPFLFAQPDRKYVSVTEQFKDSDIAKSGQVREKRKYVKKADKLAMMGQKRIYRRKTYDRFKFNTNQCIAVFKEMLD
ncbi:unnamed protein product (macronuclear) [Paramecium tetraurelia]|uniref:B box-type domain-containing protein n=1 Tax=Paramecium tetraurelia TaxID=5888 RepID=A0E0Y0_PARTE|nr:uncharacterized protein GSPATT00022116001 [Paramecium tetraurelia]CAK88947.1 unnamed protein product [Paramecium tetraurelia]|eukprot:XP_001456344.1 hypothetical protein (macronuclear) [Paramecium tetraurelia strain d4-2]